MVAQYPPTATPKTSTSGYSVTKLAASHFRKILLIKPSSLGDCLHALPVLNALHHALPDAQIHWLINQQYADLFKNHPAIQSLVIFHRQRFHSRTTILSFLEEIAQLVAKLRSERFDLVIDLQGLFRSALMSRATAARVRLGLANVREWAQLFYTHQLQPPPANIHAVDRYMRTLDTLGIPSDQRDFSFPIDPQAAHSVDKLLTRAGLPAPHKFVLVIPGARWLSKRWAPHRFAQVIDHLQNQLSLPCVLTGTSDETQLCAQIAQDCKSKPANFAGRTSLVELAALTNRCELVLGHDSGTIHLAVALSKPLVCIIGPTDPSLTGPYGREDSILKADVPCAPCRLTVCEKNECMESITVHSVVAKIRSLLPTR